jgi:hypothetical protein
VQRPIKTVPPAAAPAAPHTPVATARRRRRNQVLAGTSLTLALTLALTGAYLATHRARAVTDGASAAHRVAGQQAATTPAADPTPSASGGSATANAPDGRISLTDLSTATLQVPAWPSGMLGHCPDGPVRMGTKGSATYTPVEILGQPVYADVDRDGALETVINLTCSPQGSAQQVLAYDRDTAGAIYLLGKVVATAGPKGRQGIDIERVHRIAAAAGGRVNADVGDFFTCCGDNPDSAQHQWRSYGWDGTRFVQVDGPTEFGPNPNVTDLAVTASNLVMLRQADGTWQGTLTTSVVNRGDHPAPVVLALALSSVTPYGGGWRGCDLSSDGYASCMLGVLSAGASRTMRFDFTATKDPAGQGTISVHSETDKGVFPDSNADDNKIGVHVRAA